MSKQKNAREGEVKPEEQEEVVASESGNPPESGEEVSDSAEEQTPSAEEQIVSLQEEVAELKDQLLSLAKEQENEFAYIVRHRPYLSSPLVYKVDVKTGSESLINVGHIPICQIKDFKKGVLFSGKEKVSNLVGGNRYSGMPVSVIAPDACLINEVKISPVRPDRKLKAPAIKSPLSD